MWSASAPVALVLVLSGCTGEHVGSTDSAPLPPERTDAAVEAGTAQEAAPRSCTWVLPPACPDLVPSFRRQVDPILAKRCRPACHEPGGIEQNQALTTHAQIFARRGTVLNQIYRCKMPPSPLPPLPPEEGAVLLDWLVCGAPDN